MTEKQFFLPHPHDTGFPKINQFLNNMNCLWRNSIPAFFRPRPPFSRYLKLKQSVNSINIYWIWFTFHFNSKYLENVECDEKNARILFHRKWNNFYGNTSAVDDECIILFLYDFLLTLKWSNLLSKFQEHVNQKWRYSEISDVHKISFKSGNRSTTWQRRVDFLLPRTG